MVDIVTKNAGIGSTPVSAYTDNGRFTIPHNGNVTLTAEDNYIVDVDFFISNAGGAAADKITAIPTINTQLCGSVYLGMNTAVMSNGNHFRVLLANGDSVQFSNADLANDAEVTFRAIGYPLKNINLISEV